MSFWINFTLTFLKRKKWLVLTILLISLVVIGSGWYIFKVRIQNQVSEGVVGTHEERDLPEMVLNLLSKPLVKIDKTGAPQPELAQSWEVNSEGNIYKVKLRPDIYWSDGRKITAADIYISIPDVQINPLDDSTLEFKLAEAFSPFPSLLTKPILRKSSSTFGFDLIGTGPYKIESIKKDGPFVKKLKFVSDNKDLPKLSITFFPDEDIARTELKLGDVQALLGLSDTSTLNFNNLAKKDFTNHNQLVSIFLNTEDPILSDQNLRLALAYGAPEISGQEIAKTSLSPMSWAFNPNVKDYLSNTDKAKEALKKVEKGKDETITMTVACCLGDVGQKVTEAWNKLGLKTVFRQESGTPQNFQALLITQDIPADPDQYFLWHSTRKGSTNISGISSPRIDKDLEDGRKANNPETRKQKYQDFQKILLDEAPAIFLYFPKYEVVYMKKAERNLNKVLPIQLSNLN